MSDVTYLPVYLGKAAGRFFGALLVFITLLIYCYVASNGEISPLTASIAGLVMILPTVGLIILGLQLLRVMRSPSMAQQDVTYSSVFAPACLIVMYISVGVGVAAASVLGSLSGWTGPLSQYAMAFIFLPIIFFLIALVPLALATIFIVMWLQNMIKIAKARAASLATDSDSD